MSDAIRVNGNLLSWGSIRAKIDGSLYHGFTSVTYADKRERTMAYGMGRHHAPRGRSAGKYSTENTKLGGPTATIQALRAALARKGGGTGYGNVLFDIVIQYVEPGSSDEPLTVQLEGCVLVGNSTSNEESPDPLKEEVEISVMRIRRNDLILWDEDQEVVA